MAELTAASEIPRGAGAWASVPAPRLSFNLRLVPDVTMMFPDGDLRERLALARKSGFSAVEGGVPDKPRELKNALAAEGMSFLCMSAGRGRDEADAMGLAAIPGRQEAFRESILEGIAAASELSCRIMHAVGGLVQDGERDEYEKVYRDNLHFTCERAAEADIQILIEPICAARQPRYIVQTHAKALEFVYSIGAPNLGLMADIYHARMAGEALLEIVQKHADRIPLVQVADAPVRRQPREEDPELDAIFCALADQGWQGWISAEYVPDGPLTESLAWTRLLSSWSRNTST